LSSASVPGKDILSTCVCTKDRVCEKIGLLDPSCDFM